MNAAPRLRRARILVDLVDTFEAQHRQLNRLTSNIDLLVTPAFFRQLTNRQELVEVLRAFTLVSRAHAARENTVLLPAFRRVASRQELNALAIWTSRSRAKLDSGGFYKSLRTETARLEQAAGIADLDRLAPPF